MVPRQRPAGCPEVDSKGLLAICLKPAGARNPVDEQGFHGGPQPDRRSPRGVSPGARGGETAVTRKISMYSIVIECSIVF